MQMRASGPRAACSSPISNWKSATISHIRATPWPTRLARLHPTSRSPASTPMQVPSRPKRSSETTFAGRTSSSGSSVKPPSTSYRTCSRSRAASAITMSAWISKAAPTARSATAAQLKTRTRSAPTSTICMTAMEASLSSGRATRTSARHSRSTIRLPTSRPPVSARHRHGRFSIRCAHPMKPRPKASFIRVR